MIYELRAIGSPIASYPVSGRRLECALWAAIAASDCHEFDRVSIHNSNK